MERELILAEIQTVDDKVAELMAYRAKLTELLVNAPVAVQESAVYQEAWADPKYRQWWHERHGR